LVDDPEIIAVHDRFVDIHAQFYVDRLRLTDERSLITHQFKNSLAAKVIRAVSDQPCQ
jgi:hypothetical protein